MNLGVVEEYLKKEVGLGHVVEPFNPDVLPKVQVSHFGVIPRSHHPGEWRLIMDLSHPTGASVNNRIKPELFTLRYTSVDEAIKRMHAWGWGTLVAKLDVESAYCIIPVHPTDRLSLGMVWKGELYLDLALPFGLDRRPKYLTVWQMHSS